MKSQWTRREVLKYPIAASLATAAMQLGAQKSAAVEYNKPVPGSENLTAYLNQARVLLRRHNLPLTSYRANPAAKYPYFYPVNGPVSGLSLTSESALPYPHHRGLWFGCDPLNGGDYWSDGSLDRGQVKSVDLKVGATTKQSAVILDRCDWVRKDAPNAPTSSKALPSGIRNSLYPVHMTAVGWLCFANIPTGAEIIATIFDESIVSLGLTGFGGKDRAFFGGGFTAKEKPVLQVG